MTDAATSLGERTVRKITIRIIPYIFLLYIISFLDWVNLGYAALDVRNPRLKPRASNMP